MLKTKPRKIDYVEKIKVPTGHLRIGMYVCELDRPWLDTEFLFQGFELKTERDIDEIAKRCEYVYIDMVRTKTVEIAIHSNPQKVVHIARYRSNSNPAIARLESTREETSCLIKSFMDEVRFGKSVDVQLAKSAVSNCVSGVLSNPDAMMFMTQLRDYEDYAQQHAFNVCVYSIVLGRLLDLDAAALENLGTCGLLHDIGKVTVPRHILDKPGSFTAEETAAMQRHAIAGRDILMSGRNLYSGTVDVAYSHHEHLDGSGYPRGLEGHQLNVNSKIVAIADKYDALVSARPFRQACDHLTATGTLNHMAKKKHIDDKLAYGFSNYLGVYPPGSIVKMSNGETAIVLQSSPRERLRPQILVVRDEAGAPAERYVDLREKTTDARGQPYRIASVLRSDEHAIDLNGYRLRVLDAFG